MLICLVRRFGLFILVNAIALWLSIVSGIDRGVSEDVSFTLLSRLRSHVATHDVYEAAIYSVSHVDKATTDCFLDPYIMGFPVFMNTYPVVKRLINVLSAQSVLV
jgi:hypothetical protein